MIHDGRITAVGDDATARAEVVDLRDRLALPAFHDAHIHPLQGALEQMSCDLTGPGGVDAYAQAVRQYATQHPDRAWISGGGWSMEFFPGGARG